MMMLNENTKSRLCQEDAHDNDVCLWASKECRREGEGGDRVVGPIFPFKKCVLISILAISALCQQVV